MKRLIAALLAATMLCSLTACSQRVPYNDNTQKQQQSEVPEPVVPEPQPQPEPLPPVETTQPEPEETQKEQNHLFEPANPAAVTEFSSYAALDGSKLGWGPGGPVDELNRSQGALAYQEKYGKYDADFIGNNSKKIYLTFDQGYENGYTAPILDVLKEKDCPALFFLTGHYAKSEPELIQRMIDEGHILGNHSQNHPSFPDTPLEQCKNEVEELHEYVKENFDYEMSLFRFPAGEFSEQTLKLIQDMGYRSVFWSFAYRDWEVDNQPDPTEALQTILSKAHPGAIILLHSVSSTNAQILGDLIDQLRAQGYEFSTYEPNTEIV
ncbi:MAG: polysaccharide deacetylase family protein [Negativibacillus sp.]